MMKLDVNDLDFVFNQLSEMNPCISGSTSHLGYQSFVGGFFAVIANYQMRNHGKLNVTLTAAIAESLEVEKFKHLNSSEKMKEYKDGITLAIQNCFYLIHQFQYETKTA